MNAKQVAALIDHARLNPGITREDIEKLCQEAREWGFFSVCVSSYWVATAAAHLQDSVVRVCSVIGFPFGACRAEVKGEEARWALGEGANELDMVMNIGALRSGDETDVFEEIELVRKVCSQGTVLKVILECSLLKSSEKIRAARIAADAGADFVKTSTGFGSAGATVEDVKLLRATVGSKLGVKASGGIRDLKTLSAMVEAGANRIGTSSGVEILRAM